MKFKLILSTLNVVTLCALLVATLFGCSTANKGGPGTKAKPTGDLKSQYETEQDKEKKFYLLTDIVNGYASSELNPEDKLQIRALANDLLKMAPQHKGTWNYGNAIHQANLVLGRLQLLDNKIKSAGEYLIAASKTPGSPQLGSFGPNMTLAKEMLEKNAKSIVVTYINNCLKFWKGSDAVDKATRWKKEIAAGTVPDFGANLVY